MQRRKFLQGAAAGGVAAAATTISAPAISQGIKQLKMVTTWPKNFPGLGTGAERLAARINTMSGGKLQVKVYAAGELVPAFQSFDAVSQGKAEMSHSVSYYWQGKSPAFNFFAAVPYGFTGNEHYAWMLWGDGLKLYTELCNNFGVVPFMRASTGVQMGGWYRKEVNSLDDFKGLKFRMPGLGGEVLRRLGPPSSTCRAARSSPRCRRHDQRHRAGRTVQRSRLRLLQGREVLLLAGLPRARTTGEVSREQEGLGRPVERAAGGHPGRRSGRVHDRVCRVQL